MYLKSAGGLVAMVRRKESSGGGLTAGSKVHIQAHDAS